MSELQLSLIGAGLALVGAVFAYNKWQERKYRKLAERVFRREHEDVLLGGGQETAAAAGDERREPHSGPVPTERSAATPAEEPPTALVDPAIDCVVRFESAEPVGGAYLFQAQLQAMGRLARPPVWCGLDERTGTWRRLTAGAEGDYRRLRVALQLADRSGPLTDSDLTLFFNGVQKLADEFLAVTDLPPRNEVLARAAELDRFCAGVDIQVGLNVVATDAPFAGSKLRALAEASGLVLREDGMFHALDEEGATLFTLANLEAASFAAAEMKSLLTAGITFTLDVPRVADGARVFDRMVALAGQFAATLGGRLVDDNRAPLADAALALIHDKIAEIGQRMAARGLNAGSSQALRLFG
jgi:hypothetical protein